MTSGRSWILRQSHTLVCTMGQYLNILLATCGVPMLYQNQVVRIVGFISSSYFSALFMCDCEPATIWSCLINFLYCTLLFMFVMWSLAQLSLWISIHTSGILINTQFLFPVVWSIMIIGWERSFLSSSWCTFKTKEGNF